MTFLVCLGCSYNGLRFKAEERGNGLDELRERRGLPRKCVCVLERAYVMPSTCLRGVAMGLGCPDSFLEALGICCEASTEFGNAYRRIYRAHWA